MTKQFKIISLKNFVNKKIKSKDIVLAGGAFDLFHLGHLNYLKQASNLGKKLVVALTIDKFINKGVGRPYFKQSERAELLSHLDLVDFIIFNQETSPIKIINALKPKYYVKGPDYKNQKNDFTQNIIKEKKLVEKYGGVFKTTSGKTFSSSKILNFETDILTTEAKKFLSNIDREKIKSKIYKNLNSVRKNKIFLIGENIIDEFTYVKTLGKSQKSNILSTSFLRKESHLGGVLMVACHLSSFFEKVNVLLIGKITKDVKKKIPKNVHIDQVSCKNFDVVKKNRFIDTYNKNKLYQINYKDNFNLTDSERNILKKKILRYSTNNYKIIITDFGHGIFDEKITNFINKLKIIKYINCQTNSSNFGFNIFDKFSKSHLVCIDEQEFRLFCKNKSLPVDKLLRLNQKKIKHFKNFVITMGKTGCFFRDINNKISFSPTLINKVVDTLGSGDAFFCGMIIADQMKVLNALEKTLLSHIFGGIHSNVLGNEKYITKSDLFYNLNYALK
tara:strand:- start:756 stop:2264 length:1509 start_codon:yes stop_codon:yes gene_type:complete